MEPAFPDWRPDSRAMNDSASADAGTTEREWVRSSSADWADPLSGRVPYVELKLEHPGLDPTGYGESFFPDAVPYALDGAHRVFYWRPTLDAATDGPASAAGFCATTDTLLTVTDGDPDALDLVSRRDGGTAVVVDGTVGGESTTALLARYSAPTVRIRELSASRLALLADGEEYAVSAGTRRRVPLSERTADRADGDGDAVSVTPELVVRFPGERELHHPAPGAGYRLFPSFGLDLDAVPNPLPIPTANGEVDHAALATSLGVDLSARPYPERVLWQALAYTAFDPHAPTVPRLTQFPDGSLGLESDATE